MIKKSLALLSLCTTIIFVQCARQHRGIPRGDGYRGVGRVETTVITKNDAVIIRQELSTSNDSTQFETTTTTPVATEVSEQVAATNTQQDESVNAPKTVAQVIDSTEEVLVVNEEDLVKGHKNIKRSRSFLTVGTVGLFALFGGIFTAILSFSFGALIFGVFLVFLGLLLWAIGLIGGWITLARFKRIEFVNEADFKSNKRQKIWGLILLAPILIYALLFLILVFA
ncbi:MAG: hypothetical protein KA734_05545 [Fluviicola sp.]|nr:hypothetical protein [Fluviicola sp.]MBP6271159.1 hypothetical protein [Fluviicola sp.]